MKYFLIVILWVFAGTAVAIETGHELTREQWSVARNPESIVAMPGLSRAMQDFQATPNPRLRIHYPGGNEGNLWAAELRGWLVTLGVPSTDLEMLVGSTNVDTIDLEVISAGNETAPIMTILPDEPAERP